jgi:trans-aconitate 2-methyltransferase
MTREWDAPTYDRIADPMTRMGAAVVDRMALRGDERVLDAGCGSGRVTELLLGRLPSGHVIALDASVSMITEARARLAPYGDRVELVLADLARPLPIADPVDAILSTATFHWIRDHDALFHNLAAVLRPGGQLVAQCGGAGNVASLIEVLRHVGDGWTGPWNFATPEETSKRLRAAGFTRIETWLQDERVELEAGEPLETYLGTINLGAHLDRLAPEQRPAFVKAVAAHLPRPVLDYVRLNIVARRAA